MATAQAIKSGAGIKALALFGVFLLAKIIVLAEHTIPLSAWTPIAYLWQDVLVALVFAAFGGALDRLQPRLTPRLSPRLTWILYLAAVIYAALNIPLLRVLSSPITWPMMRAARGALSDSMLHHATPGNLAALTIIAAAGIILPRLLRRIELQPRTRAIIIVSAMLIIACGPTASARIETIGLDRNPIATLAMTALPRLKAGSAEADWRVSPFAGIGGSSSRDDLSAWRGAAAGRNVVLILLESTGAQYLRSSGAKRDPMPNLTRMAERAIVFENAYAVYPESIKTLFSVLCARYPALDTATEGLAKVATPSIAARLKSNGYRTGLFHSGRFMYLGMEEVINGRGFETLEDAGAIGGNHESSFGVDEPPAVRRILSWIDEGNKLKNDAQPFFVTYLPIAGHHPYVTPAPGPFPEREEADRYLNSLNYADAALGELVDGLRARGLYEKTLFVIAGDHGEAFGQHEGNYGHSLFIYEENVHIPYLIVAPGLITEQKRVARAVSLIDTAPTIMDLIDRNSSDQTGSAADQGQSMLIADDRMALFYTDYSLSLLGLRDGCWKFIDELESGRGKLFDLCRDPDEKRDLSAEHPERVNAYRAHLRRWSAAQKALLDRE
jgi:arylsulfatase A-like enzyme